MASAGKGGTHMRLAGEGDPPGREPGPFAQMRAYWEALRGPDGGLPYRADLDPRGIADLLENTLLLERITPGQVRVRLAGTAVCDLLGMDLRGMPLSALLMAESRATFALRLAELFDRPAIARLNLEGEGGWLRAPMTAQILILPMRGRAGRTDRALACLLVQGNPGRSPRRLRLTSGHLQPIEGLPAAAPAPASVLAEAAEAAAPYQPAPAPSRPRLRVIEGGAGTPRR